MNFAWLIEAPGQKYLAVRKLANMHDFHWTPNHVDALAFRSREQADDTMMAVRQMARMSKDGLFGFEDSLGAARATEHGWLPDAVRSCEPPALSSQKQPPPIADGRYVRTT